MTDKDTGLFELVKKCEYQDYWFVRCRECGYETNTVLLEKWRYCPSCGRKIGSE